MSTFYDIPDTEFIWHGEWADPEIEYKGELVNYYAIEDSLYDFFRDEYKDVYGSGEVDGSKFEEWLSMNHALAYELLELAIGEE